MTENGLKENVRILLDREAIKELRAKYCICLDTKNMDGLRRLFHTDITLEFGDQEVQRGIETAITFLKEKFKIYAFLVHFTHNHIIEIDGSNAKGSCYLEGYMEKDGEEIICTGYYDDRYIKEDGTWLFSSRKFNVFYFVPLKEGWAGKQKGGIKAVLQST